MRLRSFLILFIVCAGLAACRKDTPLTSGGSLRFSTDTLTFDTVFTETGSFTVGVKLYNTSDAPVKLSSVRMGGGATSPFRINVNGIPGPEVTDVEIAANDSVYVYALVRINPDTVDAPFVVQDSLIATLNGQRFILPFLAYGQNAHYINGELLRTQIWGAADKKPYVIINSALVEPGNTLTIVPGTRIYMHANSRLIVQGTLLARGTKRDSIVFQGDRLDRNYFGGRGYPGEWGGLYFDSRSNGSVLQHVVLKNGGNTALNAYPALIQVNPDSVNNGTPQLYLDKVTIQNSIGYGILSFGGSITGNNLLIHSCGANALALLQGGTYEFNNGTFHLQGTYALRHVDQPTLVALNYLDLGKGVFRDQALKATFRNSIFWGSLDDEVFCGKRPNTSYDVTLDHCLLKVKDAANYAAAQQNTILLNTDPEFTDPEKEDFHPKPTTPVKNAGAPLTANDLQTDRDEQARTGQWDLGCYKVK
jgi:hypothetical protein